MHNLILLDLGNVLLDLDFSRFTNRAAETSGKRADAIHERYIAGEAKKEFERGKLTEQEFFDVMSEWLSWPNSREELIYLWCDIFSETKGAKEVMKTMRARPMLLSDTDPAHVRWFSGKFPWVMQVERAFFSYQRGLCKSDSGAFKSVIEELSVPPGEILFFDDIPDHIERARKVGIDAHVFTNWNDALKYIK